MDETLHQRVVASFDQAASRGIPASEIVRRLAGKFSLREERILAHLTEADRIGTMSYSGTTIVWPATSELIESSNRNMEQHSTSTLLQAGINVGLARGTLSPQYLAQTPPEKVMRELFGQVLGSAESIESASSESQAA